MKKLIYMILSFFKYILILWVPILLIEETFLLDYIDVIGTFICSLLMSVICLIIYIKTYKKAMKEGINCYIYNIINTILLGITNLVLGYLFMILIDLNLFHQCVGYGWDCFLFGIEYWLIGIEYAILPAIILVIWLIGRLIRFLKIKRRDNL